MTDLSTIHRIVADIKTKEAELQVASRDALKDGFKAIFEQYPFLGAIRWTQYTPYFNDGEPCTFGVGEVVLSSVNDEAARDEFESPSFWECGPEFDRLSRESLGWGSTAKPNPDYNAEYAKAGDAAYALIQAIPERTLESVFGDHVSVTVTPAGVDVEEYGHD